VSWKNFASSLKTSTDSCTVWKKIKQIRAPSVPSPISITINNHTITSENEIADALARNFANRGVPNTSSGSSIAIHKETVRSSDPWYNQPITSHELHISIKNMKSNSPGPDKIPAAFLTNLPYPQREHIITFYNFVRTHGFPQQWKYSHIVPILKPGKASNREDSFRPIALTNVLCKLTERIIVRRLQKYLENSKTLDGHQSGFRARHSTLDSLFHLEASIRTALIQNDSVVTLFIDITQAFDSVNHSLLLKKLLNFKHTWKYVLFYT
jgi:hypothetical protein